MDYKKLSFELIEDFLGLLVHYNMVNTFNRVCKKYNELILEVDSELMRKIDEANVPELTYEQSQKMKEEIFAKIRQHEISEEQCVRFLKAVFEEDR